MRFQKHKGSPAGAIEAHHERTKERYASNPDIDTSRSHQNFHIIEPEKRYRTMIENRIKEVGCRTRKDSIKFVDTLITASGEVFEDMSTREIASYFKIAGEFLIDRLGEENIISAVVHMDEKVPHMHLTFVPITEDNRLSAKEIIGNKAKLTKWQDDFHARMVSCYPELERGKSARETGRKHIPMRMFKQSVHLTEQAKEIQSLLDEMNFTNTKKKRDEVVTLLHKWFPKMEDFATQMKKYQATLNDMSARNKYLSSELSAKSAELSEQKLQGEIEKNRLSRNYKKMETFVMNIPKDIRDELVKMQNQQKSRNRGLER